MESHHSLQNPSSHIIMQIVADIPTHPDGPLELQHLTSAILKAVSPMSKYLGASYSSW